MIYFIEAKISAALYRMRASGLESVWFGVYSTTDMQNPFKGPWVSSRAVFKEQVLQEQELYAELVISLLQEERCVQTAFFQ